MTTAYRLIGNRDLAAAYRGEAQRLLFHLKQSLGETPSGGLHRTYPDGTKISIRKFFDDDIILIDSPFFGEKPQPEKPYQGDVIVFYSTPAGEYRVAVTDTRIFGAEDPPAIASWLTSKWSMSVSAVNLKIFGKRFNYKGEWVWYYRLPFSLTLTDNYLFSGLSMQGGGVMNDYLYVEKTGKWYSIRTGVLEKDPFNVGNYIYLYASGQIRAYDFDFDAETFTTVKEITVPYTGNMFGFLHLDETGSIYYAKKEILWATSNPLAYTPPDWGRAFDGINPSPYYIGVKKHAYSDLYYLSYDSFEASREFGDWPGLSFVDPYYPLGRFLDIDLYTLTKWDMWGEVESSAGESPSYEQTWFNLSAPLTGFIGRNYQKYIHYPLAGRILTDKIDLFPLLEQKEIFTTPFEFTVVQDPPGTINRAMNHSYRENWRLVYGDGSILTDAAMDLSGTDTEVGPNGQNITTEVTIDYDGHRCQTLKGDFEFLFWPLGKVPFGIYQIYLRSRHVEFTANDKTDDNPDWNDLDYHPPQEWFQSRTLFTPYGEKELAEDEVVSAWGFLDGKGFLLQSLNTAVTFGNILWVDGRESAKNNLIGHLKTTWDRIYGIMLCPGIGSRDQAYKDGQEV